MNRLARTTAALTLGALLAATPAGADELRYSTLPDVPVSLGIGGVALGTALIDNGFVPDACSWCGTNGFDTGISESLAWDNHELASTFSDWGAMVVLPAASLATGIAGDGWKEGLVDAVVVGEAVAVSFIAVDVLKHSIARQRPLAVYLESDEPKRLASPDEENLSFPSGHAATAFSIVAATATVAELRGRNPLPIWLIGVPAAASVAWFRVAGLHHWTTDVLTGAAIGTGVGVLIPRLLHGPNGVGGSGSRQLGLSAALSPESPTVSFSGSW